MSDEGCRLHSVFTSVIAADCLSDMDPCEELKSFVTVFNFSIRFFGRPPSERVEIVVVVEVEMKSFHSLSSRSQSFTVQLITLCAKESFEFRAFVADAEVGVEEGLAGRILVWGSLAEDVVDLCSSGGAVFVILIPLILIKFINRLR